MNTPKYSVNLNRNVSPLRSTSKGKYYSADEVNKIVRSAFEPKIQFLMEELEEKQKVIGKLNNKLNENDEKLIQQRNMIEAFLRKGKEGHHTHASIVATINQIINDKTKQHWETIGAQIKQISSKVQQEYDPKRLEAIIASEMDKLKATVSDFIEKFKIKSNNYWQKIKEALNRINGKLIVHDKDLADLHGKLQTFQNQRMQDRETINQLQNSKNVVKNLIQLKKSVGNIYENYQAVLTLQKGLKQKMEERHGDSLWHQHEFFESTIGRKQYPSEQIVALEYSKEEILPPGDREMFEEFDRRQNTTQPIISSSNLSPLKINQDKSSTDLLQLQKTNPINKSAGDHSELFSLNTSQNAMNSRIQNSTLLINLSLQNRKQMCLGIRQRLLQLMQIKNLSRPLQIRYDEQINYLKSAQGNYLFDVKGNMFKINLNDLTKLEQQGIVQRSGKPKKHSLSTSKMKKNP